MGTWKSSHQYYTVSKVTEPVGLYQLVHCFKASALPVGSYKNIPLTL